MSFEHRYNINVSNRLSISLQNVTECKEGTYGPGCTQECKCVNGAMCDHISGACVCSSGWRGKFCTKACPEGFYGMCLLILTPTCLFKIIMIIMQHAYSHCFPPITCDNI